MERSKGFRLKGRIENPNALHWRLDQLLGRAFIQIESSNRQTLQHSPSKLQKSGRLLIQINIRPIHLPMLQIVHKRFLITAQGELK